MENGGRVTDAAPTPSARRSKLEPDDPRPASSWRWRWPRPADGEAALQAFRDLERQAPPDAPWLPAVRNEIASLGGVGLRRVRRADARAGPAGQSDGRRNGGRRQDDGRRPHWR